MSEPVDLLRQPIWIFALDGLHDPSVQAAPPVLEQALVGDLLRQRVREGVLAIWICPHLLDELRAAQRREDRLEARAGHVRDRSEDGDAQVLADDCRRLQNELLPPVTAGRCEPR